MSFKAFCPSYFVKIMFSWTVFDKIIRPRIRMTVLCLPVIVLHQWRYREQYERAKDKFTSVLETPEYEAHKRSKKISDVSFYTFIYSTIKTKSTHPLKHKNMNLRKELE